MSAPGIGAVADADHALVDHSQAAPRSVAAIIVPFGAAASPDLTVLPVALAASGIGLGAVLGVLATFSAATLGTFVVLTVGATIAGYQIKGQWLEDYGTLITGGVLAIIGAVFAGI